jgi:hypothetical protein
VYIKTSIQTTTLFPRFEEMDGAEKKESRPLGGAGGLWKGESRWDIRRGTKPDGRGGDDHPAPLAGGTTSDALAGISIRLGPSFGGGDRLSTDSIDLTSATISTRCADEDKTYRELTQMAFAQGDEFFGLANTSTYLQIGNCRKRRPEL